MWRRALRTGTRVAIHIAALLFVMLAALAVVLAATGSVDRAKLRAIASLVRDEAEAVEGGALADLRRAKETLAKRDRTAPEEREARAVVERADALKKERIEELARSEEVLRFLLAEVKRRQAEVDARIQKWETERRSFDEQRLAEAERREAAALARVRKIITNFDAEMIAQSYQQKYAGSGAGVATERLERAKREVIDDFLMLRESFVTEILAAFEGDEAPKLRMEILERLKKAGTRDKLAEGGGNPITGGPGAP